MRRTSSSVGIGLLLALAGSAGCTETPPPAVPTVTPGTVAVATSQPSAPSDLAPVPEPADIFVTARWKSPSATFAGIGSCAGVPSQMVDTNLKTVLDKSLARAFRGGVDGKQIADVIALDAPVDLVVALAPGRRGQPEPLVAFSVGLTSLDRARGTLEAGGPLVELQPGMWRVGTKEGNDLSCVIGPAAGAAPARLICGPHDKDVIALGPYLARNLAVAPPPAHDVHAQMSFLPIEARYGDDLRKLLVFLPTLARTKAIGEPHFDKALEEGAVGLADEARALSADLDHVSFDLGVDGASCLTASGTLQLRGKSSWLAGTMAEMSGKAGPPPAIFWRAPVDSDSASYGRAADATRYTGIIHVLRGLLEGELAREKIGSEADRSALAALLSYPLGKDSNYVVASGHVRGGPKPAASGAKPSEEQLVSDLTASSLGWYLVGFDEGPATLSKLMKDLVAVYARKGLTDPLRKALAADADALPTAKLVPAPAQLGKGALDLELRFALPARKHGDADPKKKKGALVIHTLLMGEAHSAWMAIGGDREELVRRLLGAKSGAPDSGTLTSRAGLEPLRDGKAVSSGFLTLGVITRRVTSLLDNPNLPGPLSGSPPVADLANTLNNLPHKGETPIFLSSTATGAGPRTEFSVNVQKGSFEDVGAILITGLRIATNAGLLRP